MVVGVEEKVLQVDVIEVEDILCIFAGGSFPLISLENDHLNWCIRNH